MLVFLEAQIKSTCISHNSFLYIFHKTLHNKLILEFGFCDIRINEGFGKLIISDITKIHPIIVYNVQFCHHFCTDDLITLFFNLLRQNADDIQNRLFVRIYLSEL